MSPKKSSNTVAGEKEPEKLLLLDVSSLVYRAYHALPELTASDGSPAGALYGFVAILVKVLNERKPSHVAAAIDLPGKTRRHEQYPAYKATRPPTPDELIVQLNKSYELLGALGVPVFSAEGYEADDVIATIVAQTRKTHPATSVELLSGDQDLLQLVDARTSVLAPKRGIAETAVLTPEGVREKLGVPPELVVAYKALRGDPSDNIPGVRGIGPKTAAALLAYAGSLGALIAKAQRLPDDAPRELKRFAEKITQRKDELMRGEKLVTLAADAPVAFDYEKTRYHGAATPAFSAMLKRLGFEALLRRVHAASTARRSTDEHESLEAFIAAQEQQVRREIDAHLRGGVFSEDIAALERALVPVISAMERRGIAVDKRTLAELEARFSQKRSTVEREVFSLAGHEFNLASPKQLAQVLFEELGIRPGRKTAGGQRSTAAAVLEELADSHEIVRKILSWRETQKLLTTYIAVLPKLVDPKDGRIHARFWQLGTVTGRIASSDPNLQNIPVRGEDGRAVRNAFVASEDRTLLSADYEQIELRVAAVLAEDDAMLEAFQRGDDIHKVTARRIFAAGSGTVDAEMRRRAKVLNFGILYGMGPRRVAKEMGVSLQEAHDFLDEYFAAFPKLAFWMREVVERARRDGFTQTAFGRKRFFPEIVSENHMLRTRAERAAVNAPIQGTAADLVKRGMVALARAVPQAAILVQVHDEILCEVPSEKLQTVAGHAREILESVWEDAPAAFPVRLGAGPRWGALEELTAKAPGR